MENRHDKILKVVKLPVIFVPEYRGEGLECCEFFQVLADPFSNDSWKNDTELAWIIAGSADFILKKDGIITDSYTPQTIVFPNDPEAFYTQVSWQEVIVAHGPGEYTIEIQSVVSGIPYVIPWGSYVLSQYNYRETRGTMRVKSVFNTEIKSLGINFTGANAVRTLRVRAEISERQPNFQIENDQFTSDLMFPTNRENLRTYKMVTVPIGEMIGDVLELQLLAENECYISDYNATAYSKKWLDLPVIVDKDAGGPKSPPAGGGGSALCRFECTFGDKVRDQKAKFV